jgi:hypothetical protein
MPMLSELVRWDATDLAGHRAPLADLVVDLAAGDYPPVTGMIVTLPGKASPMLPWNAFRALDAGSGKLVVSDLYAGSEMPASALAQAVLLKRDILDAMVLDLQAHRAMRVNDLWLEMEDHRLTLCAVDASFSAILRRLSRNTLGHGRDLHD